MKSDEKLIAYGWTFKTERNKCSAMPTVYLCNSTLEEARAEAQRFKASASPGIEYGEPTIIKATYEIVK